MVSVVENNRFEVLTIDGFKSFDGISSNIRSEMVYIETYNGFYLTCTIDHQINTQHGFTNAGNLRIGDSIITNNGVDILVCKEFVFDENEVFDLVNVQDTNSFICNGIDIHNCLIVDERAFIPMNLWDSFISSVYPTISSSPNSKVIYVSTFNGLNHFYRDWCDANDGKNEFYPIRVDWWQVPLKGSTTGFRDEHWKDETISNIGQTRFNQEFGNQALGSITTLIEPKVVAELKHAHPIECKFHAKIDSRLHRFLNIYEDVKPNNTYVIGVDSCKMTDENSGDALGMQIIDITTFPIKQVATFFAQSGISYLQAPEIIAELGKYYNNALAFIENNEVGQEVANIVHNDYEYENTYFEKGNLPGFRTTKKTKRLGCTNLKLLIENNKLILNDFNTIGQLSTFVKKKQSYQAENGYQDDLVMALISALFVFLAQGIDLEISEGNADLGKKILEASNIMQLEDEPIDFSMPDDYEDKIVSDFDWLN